MAERIIDQAIKRKWIEYNRKDGPSIHFGAYDFILLLLMFYLPILLNFLEKTMNKW